MEKSLEKVQFRRDHAFPLTCNFLKRREDKLFLGFILRIFFLFFLQMSISIVCILLETFSSTNHTDICTGRSSATLKKVSIIFYYSFGTIVYVFRAPLFRPRLTTTLTPYNLSNPLNLLITNTEISKLTNVTNSIDAK